MSGISTASTHAGTEVTEFVVNMEFVGAFGVATQVGYAIYGLAGALIIGGSTLISSLGTQKAVCSTSSNRKTGFPKSGTRSSKSRNRSKPDFLWLFV